LRSPDGNFLHKATLGRQHDTSHAIRVQVRDASTGELVRSVQFLAASWSAHAFAAFADIDGNGVQELGIAARQDDGAVRVQIKDASNGSAIATIDIP
jgi:hypothetical protein